MRHPDIGPPVPGRNSDLFRQVVNPIDGAAFVRARNHKRPPHSRHRVFHHRGHRRLPLARDPAHIQLVPAHQRIDQRTPPDGSDEYDIDPGRRLALYQRRIVPRNPAYIQAQIAGRPHHSRPILVAHHQRRCLAVCRQHKCRRRRRLTDILWPSQGVARFRP